MIENPNNWFHNSIRYAVDNNYPFRYGYAFLLKKDAPQSVVAEYVKYLNLIKKVFFSSGIGVFKPIIINGQHRFKLVGIKEDLSKFEKEQADIFLKLIDDGYISNEPFI